MTCGMVMVLFHLSPSSVTLLDHLCPINRLRSWTSCGSTAYSSQQEQSRSPATLTSTYSLETMPKFAFSSEDESPCAGSLKAERPMFVLGDPEAGAGGAAKSSALSGIWAVGGDAGYSGRTRPHCCHLAKPCAKSGAERHGEAAYVHCAGHLHWIG